MLTKTAIRRMDLPKVTPAESLEKGYTPLTNPYLVSELWMLDRVIDDMDSGGIKFDLVIEFTERPKELSLYREP